MSPEPSMSKHNWVWSMKIKISQTKTQNFSYLNHLYNLNKLIIYGFSIKMSLYELCYCELCCKPEFQEHNLAIVISKRLAKTFLALPSIIEIIVTKWSVIVTWIVLKSQWRRYMIDIVHNLSVRKEGQKREHMKKKKKCNDWGWPHLKFR